MSKVNSVVAVYHTHTEADQAVKELQRGGVDMHKLSIVGKGYHTDEQVVGYYNTGDRMKYWGKVGAFWGGFWGLLFGSAFFMIPGLGPILAAGPIVAWIVAALEGAVEVGVLGALGAGLYSIGIPKDSIVKYETALKTDQFLLIAHGTAAEVAKAKDIIETTHPAELGMHSGEAVAGSRLAFPRIVWARLYREALPIGIPSRPTAEGAMGQNSRRVGPEDAHDRQIATPESTIRTGGRGRHPRQNE